MRARIDPIFIGVPEAAEALAVNRARLYHLLNTGEIEGRYEGSKRLVVVESLRKYAAGLPMERAS